MRRQWSRTAATFQPQSKTLQKNGGVIFLFWERLESRENHSLGGNTLRIKTWPVVVLVVVLMAGIGTFAWLRIQKEDAASPHLLLQQDGNTAGALSQRELEMGEIPIQQRQRQERAPYLGCSVVQAYEEYGIEAKEYQAIEVVSKDNRISLFPISALDTTTQAYLSYDKTENGEGFCFFWVREGGQVQQIERIERINLLAAG